LPTLVAEVAWPLEMLRIKGALRGGPLPRNPTGIPIEAGTPLTAMLPSLFEALGLHYHHLDVNIGKVIVPGPTPGRDYSTFEEIGRDPRASFVRAQALRCGPEPRVLCADADVAGALVGEGGCAAKVTRLTPDPMDMMRAGPSESIILGTPRSTLQHLAQQGKSFDAVFLSGELLPELPEGLLSPGGRVVPTETLPLAGKVAAAS